MAQLLDPSSALQRLRFLRMGLQEIGAIAAVFLAAALTLGFVAIAEEVVEGDTQTFDTAILMAFRTPGSPSDRIGPPWLEEMVRDITALGSYAFIVVVLVAVLGYLLLVRKRALAILVAAAVAGGTAISHLLKLGFDRPRPDVEQAARVFTASFPSGHATLSAVTFLTIGALLTRVHADWRVKLYFISIAVLLTVVIGLSRIYLGVHYPTDVLAGWCLGSAWASLCWSVALWLQLKGRAEEPAPS